MNMNNRTTILLSASRSYVNLEKAVNQINETMFGDDMFIEDRIKLNTVLNNKNEVEHYEITGSPLSFFQIGLKYGAFEENEYLQPFLMEIFKSSTPKK